MDYYGTLHDLLGKVRSTRKKRRIQQLPETEAVNKNETLPVTV